MAILLVSVLVTQYALGLFKNMMAEEGYDYDAKSAVGMAESGAAQGAPGAAAGSDRPGERADQATGSPVTSMASIARAPPLNGAKGGAPPGSVSSAGADERDAAAEEALAFVAEAQAAQVAAGALGGVPRAARAQPDTERGTARLAQIAAREAEIAARLRELDAAAGRKSGDGSV